MTEGEKTEKPSPSPLIMAVLNAAVEKQKKEKEYTRDRDQARSNRAYFLHYLGLIPPEKQATIQTMEELIRALNNPPIKPQEEPPHFYQKGKIVEIQGRKFEIVDIYPPNKQLSPNELVSPWIVGINAWDAKGGRGFVPGIYILKRIDN